MKSPASNPAPALKKTEKGANRSMWELLLELRVLLPYLAPLLDRGLRSAPDFSEATRGIAEVQTAIRDLEVQATNQAVQLERIEQQMSRLRVVHENSIEESRRLFAAVGSLRRGLLGTSIVLFALLLATIVMVTLLVMHS